MKTAKAKCYTSILIVVFVKSISNKKTINMKERIYMELTLENKSICINEVVLDTTIEQPVELDYLLPDYCESIFKILQQKIVAKITSQRIANGKLMFDGVCYIKIIYVSEENYHIKTINQKQAFSKSIDLKEEYENATVSLFCKTDYVNCRVVNQQRLDIRGAISIKVTITAPKKINVLHKADGMGMQINTKNITALSERLSACKEFSIKEELELGYGKPDISEILDSHTTVILSEYKIIQNKIIAKGEIKLHIIYSSKEDCKPEIMEHSILISQIIDIDKISENYECVILFDVTNINLQLKANGDGNFTCYDAEFQIKATVFADKNDEFELINDIYSTGFMTKTSIDKIKIEQLVMPIRENAICKSIVKIPANEINCVYDISCIFSDECCKFNNKLLTISGNLNCSILALDCENMPILIEKSTPCATEINCNCENDNISFSPNVSIENVSYNMNNSEEIEICANIKICGNVFASTFYEVVNSVELSEKKITNDQIALRLYFPNQNELLWDIAKKFNTSIAILQSENNLDNESICNKNMLLIPTINLI